MRPPPHGQVGACVHVLEERGALDTGGGGGGGLKPLCTPVWEAGPSCPRGSFGSKSVHPCVHLGVRAHNCMHVSCVRTCVHQRVCV